MIRRKKYRDLRRGKGEPLWQRTWLRGLLRSLDLPTYAHANAFEWYPHRAAPTKYGFAKVVPRPGINQISEISASSDNCIATRHASHNQLNPTSATHPNAKMSTDLEWLLLRVCDTISN